MQRKVLQEHLVRHSEPLSYKGRFTELFNVWVAHSSFAPTVLPLKKFARSSPLMLYPPYVNKICHENCHICMPFDYIRHIVSGFVKLFRKKWQFGLEYRQVLQYNISWFILKYLNMDLACALWSTLLGDVRNYYVINSFLKGKSTCFVYLFPLTFQFAIRRRKIFNFLIHTTNGDHTSSVTHDIASL